VKNIMKRGDPQITDKPGDAATCIYLSLAIVITPSYWPPFTLQIID
jgi:hypothetical protein